MDYFTQVLLAFSLVFNSSVLSNWFPFYQQQSYNQLQQPQQWQSQPQQWQSQPQQWQSQPQQWQSQPQQWQSQPQQWQPQPQQWQSQPQQWQSQPQKWQSRPQQSQSQPQQSQSQPLQFESQLNLRNGSLQSNNRKPLRSQQGVRISAEKCEEYKNMTFKSYRFGGLSLSQANYHELKASTCDLSIGLVVNGVEAKEGELPHMGHIGYRDALGAASFVCGGSLISESFVLTAAHCKQNRRSSGFVRFGAVKDESPKAVDYDIQQFISHEKYNGTTNQHDIAVIKLKGNVAFILPQGIRPTCLWQTKRIDHSKTLASGWGATGYGESQTSTLMKVVLDIFDTSRCVKKFEEDSRLVINENQICAGAVSGGEDTCQGDSGGPIQVVLPDCKCIAHIIGITSYGLHCGGKNSASVYTRVSAYLDWIEDKVWG